MTINIELLKKLRRLYNEGPTKKQYGICSNIHYDDGFEALLSELFMKWPKFSGSMEYPVPSTIVGLTPMDMFNFGEDIWRRNTQYGQDRWNLLEFLIEQLESEIKLSEALQYCIDTKAYDPLSKNGDSRFMCHSLETVGLKFLVPRVMEKVRSICGHSCSLAGALQVAYGMPGDIKIYEHCFDFYVKWIAELKEQGL